MLRTAVMTETRIAESEMSDDGTTELGDTKSILDQSIFWKTLTSQYYEFLSKVVSDAIMKQRFRLMASEERDHRKILRKYRRELVGTAAIELLGDEKKRLKEYFTFLEVKDRGSMDVAVTCILKAEQLSTRFFNQASSRIDNREGRIFLRLLAEEGLIHRSMVEELMEYADSKDIRFSKNSAAIAAAARR